MKVIPRWMRILEKGDTVDTPDGIGVVTEATEYISGHVFVRQMIMATIGDRVKEFDAVSVRYIKNT